MFMIEKAIAIWAECSYHKMVKSKLIAVNAGGILKFYGGISAFIFPLQWSSVLFLITYWVGIKIIIKAFIVVQKP